MCQVCENPCYDCYGICSRFVKIHVMIVMEYVPGSEKTYVWYGICARFVKNPVMIVMEYIPGS